MSLKHKKISLYIVGLLILNQIPLYFLYERGSKGLLLAVFLMALVVISLYYGTVVGLFTSLIYLFIVGSMIFYIQLRAISVWTIPFNMQGYFIYGLTLLILVLLAGKIHESVQKEDEEIADLKEQITKYVAVDVTSGFDNFSRLEKSVIEEVKRSNRAENAFVYLMIEVQHFKDFKKLYGENEINHLVMKLAENINKSMRLTDKKFRYDEDHFALILPATSNEYIQVIYAKLADNLKEHRLLSGNLVTLSFKAGHYIYQPHTEVTFQEMVEISQSESLINEI